MLSQIYYVDKFLGNQLYIKREDLIPFSFGGNKARKAFLFFESFDKGDYDCIVTYGSGSSNHCRVIANISASRQLDCFIIAPQESYEKTYNSDMMSLLGAHMTIVPVDNVSNTINQKIESLRNMGRKPYFIPGGGHGNIGTQAFVNCYQEIQNSDVRYDYIFLASGTGTTQAGLVAGKLIYEGNEKIVGISVAREAERGKKIIFDSVMEYLSDEKKIDGNKIDENKIRESIFFEDNCMCGGYGKANDSILSIVKDVFIKYGIPLDSTYTGKAFWGMREYMLSHKLIGKKILFIHTGGTPLFFDNLSVL